MGFVEVTSDNWDREVVQSADLTVVDFWHQQCRWCKLLDPLLEELSQEFHDRVRFVKFDVLASEGNWNIASRLGVYASPTLVFFCNGKQAGVVTGFRPKAVLKDEIQSRSTQCTLACT